MKTLYFSIKITAPRAAVWQAMLSDRTYREWTGAFMPGSHFVGEWKAGSKIQFLSADENGKLGGMTSVIEELKPNEFVSIHHLGVVADGVEDITSAEAKEWNGHETYTFKSHEDSTIVKVSVDVKDEYADYFQEVWPKALRKLKEVAEAGAVV